MTVVDNVVVSRADLELILYEAVSDRDQVIAEFGLSTDKKDEADIAWEAAYDRLKAAVKE